MFVAAAVWLALDPAVLLREQEAAAKVSDEGAAGGGQDRGAESESSWDQERKSAEGI